MLNQILLSAVLMIAPIKHEDRKPDIPKQDAMIEFEENRGFTRKERRAYKHGK